MAVERALGGGGDGGGGEGAVASEGAVVAVATAAATVAKEVFDAEVGPAAAAGADGRLRLQRRERR